MTTARSDSVECVTLQDMLGAMSLIKKQTWGKADKTLGRLQVNTRLLHVEITRQAYVSLSICAA